MFYSGGTPEFFACNKINRKEKDRRILNTKLANIIYIWETSKPFESISIGNSSEWYVSVPAKAGYTRFAVLVQKVSGSGSNSVIVNIHGDMPDKMISVHAGYTKLTNVTVVIAAIYIKDGFISIN